MRTRYQAWLIIGVLFGAVLLSSPETWLPKQPPSAPSPRFIMPDFLAFYTAGVLLRDDPGHLYDAGRQAEVQSSIVGRPIGPGDAGFMPFGYPALTALFFVPFAALPYSYAFIAMVLVNVVLCGIALELLTTTWRLKDEAGRLLVLCAAVSLPVMQTLSMGQVSFVVFIIYILLITDIRGHRTRAGFWAGFLVLKPTLMPVFCLWFLIRREWRSLAYTVATASTLLLVSAAVMGPAVVPSYIAMSMDMSRGRFQTVNSARMPNLRSLADFLGYGPFVLAGLVVLVLAVLFYKSKETSPSALAVLILSTLLMAPHVHYQDLNSLWIIPAMALSEVDRTTLLWRWGLFGGTLLITAILVVLASHHVYIPILSMLLLTLLLAFGLPTSPALRRGSCD